MAGLVPPLALPGCSQDAPSFLQLRLGLELLPNSSPGSQPALEGAGKEVWEEVWQLEGQLPHWGLQKFRDGGTGKISGIRERMFVPLCPLSLLSCSNDLGRPLGIRAEGTASQNAASTP